MFCPQCRSEYRTGFTRCADCGVDLVDRLPERGEVATDADNTGPVIVFTTSGAGEAALVRSLLEASGVDVYCFDENLSRIHSFYATAIGGIKLAVAPNQVELARDILAEFRGKAGENPLDGHITPFASDESEAVEDEPENGDPSGQ